MNEQSKITKYFGQGEDEEDRINTNVPNRRPPYTSSAPKTNARPQHPPKPKKYMMPHYFYNSWIAIKNLLQQIAFKNYIKNTADLFEALQKICMANYISKRPNFLTLLYITQKMEENGILDYFLSSLVPFIASLAVKVDLLLPGGIEPLTEYENKYIEFSKEQVGSLLALAFFCAVPKQKELRVPFGPNFYSIYEDSSSAMKELNYQKFCFIVNYFTRLSLKIPQSTISFERISLSREACHSLDREFWSNSKDEMMPVLIRQSGFIEEDTSTLNVDFANKFIGGGVLGHGAVQEEILFLIMPELLVSRFFVEMLHENEAIIIVGAEQYSKYSGYNNDLKFDGDYQDTVVKDKKGRLDRHIVAIDALKFSTLKDQIMQYHTNLVIREINKAYIGFIGDKNEQDSKVKRTIGTGRWGCGAFGGDSQLKFIIQWIAASINKRQMDFYVFKDPRLEKLSDIIEFFENKTIGFVFDVLMEYNYYFYDIIMKENEMRKEADKIESESIFDFILKKTGLA